MLRLLQVTAAVSSLEPAVAQLRDALDLSVSFRDPGVALFGLENAVLPVGDTFLELVAPLPGPRGERSAAARYLAQRGGDTGYMVILQVADLAPHRERLARCGVRIAWEGSAAPEGEAGPRWTGLHLHPKDTGGTLLSLDQPEPPDSWLAAGPRWREHVRTQVVSEVVRAELQSDDPQRLGRRWAELLGRPLLGDAIALDRGELRFAQAPEGRAQRGRRPSGGPAEAFTAVDLRASKRDRVGAQYDIAGLRLRLV